MGKIDLENHKKHLFSTELQVLNWQVVGPLQHNLDDFGL